ncbi:MAG: FxLYD domain-containing protein [Armatimonadota bacterium]
MIRRYSKVFAVLSVVLVVLGVFALIIEYYYYWREPSHIHYGPHPEDLIRIPGGIKDLGVQHIKLGTGKYDTGYAVGIIENFHNNNFAYAYIVIDLYNRKGDIIGNASTTVYELLPHRSKEFRVPIDKKGVASVKVRKVTGTPVKPEDN